MYTWGRNENWQLGYEVVGLLNAGQSLDAQQEPQAVELPTESPVAMLSSGELGTAALLADRTIYVMGMGRFFEPTKLAGAAGIDGTIVDMQLGAYHIGILTDEGRMFTFGTGTALALPKGASPHSIEAIPRSTPVCCASSDAAVGPLRAHSQLPGRSGSWLR